MKITTNLSPSTIFNDSYGCVVYPELEITEEQVLSLSEEQRAAIQSPEYSKFLEPVPLQFWFDVTSEENIIWFKFINVATDTTIFNFKLDYNIIKNNNNYDDQTFWAVNDNFKAAHDSYVEQNNAPYNIQAEHIVPIFSQTYTAKEKQLSKAALSISCVPFKIFVPYKNCPINELIFYVSKPLISDDYRKVPISFTGPDGSTATITTTSITEETAQLTFRDAGWKPGWLELISDITLQATPDVVNVGTNVIVNITTEVPQISAVYIEPIVGVSNKTRVALTNGQGSFIAKTEDLQIGDEVRMKLGYKYFTGVAEYTKVIT